MDKATTSIVTVRLLMGWFMLVDGLQNALNPAFTAGMTKFLLGAKTFPAFYAIFANPAVVWWMAPLNAWGITLIGVALILGFGIRLSSLFGAFLMVIYYFPHYAFPAVPNGFIVEDHLIYAAVFIMLASLPAAQRFGVNGWLRRSWIGRIPLVGALI